MKIVVLGIGNILMRDDGIGVYVVESLKGLGQLDVTYIIGETDLDYCLDAAEGSSFLFVIDAITTGKPPGTISRFELRQMPVMELGISAHNLHLFHMLHDSKVKGQLIGIEAATIDFHLGLSDILERKFLKIVEHVRRTMEDEIEILGK
ncbi:hydrogenase maturation protease [Thalassobacillus cyri]|uniref:Hydrogenase maturation protease n=1 Tax=Thalassobacillus cyri TaxID=571932 RepID=A0A1H3Z3A3_9BACI|nr:hydrogenase maturation protease [Thalassobacillus cyri]SEA18249.1 hydrogenase maturation protease [Thalassobacillus cyri]